MPAITALATFVPTSNARTWQSTPHPHLPILATACADHTARVYSLTNFRQHSALTGGHQRSVRSCAWKPNSMGETVLATGSFDASVGVWKRWEEGAVIPAEERDFTNGMDDEEDEEWRFAVVLDGHESEIKCLSWSPVQELLATSSRDKSVWVWEFLGDDNFETVAVLQEHTGDVKTVAWHPSEPLLASGSYDDTIRLWREDMDDWACCSLINGHKGTVWWVEFEGADRKSRLLEDSSAGLSDEQKALLQARETAGPRLISCSDDRTIRIWHRVPKARPEATSTQQSTPSIWKNRDFEEEWVEEARLPGSHEQPVYAVSWSKKTGRVASTGSDGRVVVYEERWRGAPTETNGDLSMPDVDGQKLANGVSDGHAPPALTEWVVMAEVEDAHDVFEINHVTWAPRADEGRRLEGEEILVSTGDDGEIKAWTFDP